MELQIQNLAFSYSDHPVLADIQTSIVPGLVTAIAGPNGVGKSTLLKCMARLLRADSGDVLYGEASLLAMKRRALARLQAYVPQSTATSFPLTAEEYILLGRKPYVDWSLRETDYAIIEEAIAYMGVEALRTKFMDELSGGERQKVVLTRALVQQPDILLLDEPTSALDIKHQMEVLLLLRKIAAERGCIVVIVLHDLTLIERFADRVILMQGGRILASGETAAVMTEENIHAAYEIQVKIVQTEYGRVVIPLKG